MDNLLIVRSTQLNKYDEYTFQEFAEYYYGVHAPITGELPLYWWDRMQPVADEL